MHRLASATQASTLHVHFYLRTAWRYITFLLRHLLVVGLAARRLQLLSIGWFLMALSCDVGQCVRLDSNFIVNLNLAAALIYYMSSKSGSYVVEMFTTSSEILSSSGSTCMFSSFSKASLLLSFFNCTCCDLAPLKSLLFTTPIACAFGLSRQEELLHACCEGSYSAWVKGTSWDCLTSCDWLCVWSRQRTAGYSHSHVSTDQGANSPAAAGRGPGRLGWWKTISTPTWWHREHPWWQEEKRQKQVQASHIQ